MPTLEEKLETLQMMQLAETGFTEWNEEEENIYNESELKAILTIAQEGESKLKEISDRPPLTKINQNLCPA